MYIQVVLRNFCRHFVPLLFLGPSTVVVVVAPPQLFKIRSILWIQEEQGNERKKERKEKERREKRGLCPIH